eukprot:COSAG01_NODE_64674_length_275_cov_5.198864_1_plen_62_part_10
MRGDIGLLVTGVRLYYAFLFLWILEVCCCAAIIHDREGGGEIAESWATGYTLGQQIVQQQIA